MDILITDLYKNGARFSQKISRCGESIAKVRKIRMDPIPPGISKRHGYLALNPSDQPRSRIPRRCAAETRFLSRCATDDPLRKGEAPETPAE